MSAIRVVCKKCGETYRWEHVGSKDYGPVHIGCPASKKQKAGKDS